MTTTALATAHANPATLVPSAAEPNNSVDLHLRLDYEYQVDTARIFREVLGTAGPLDPVRRNRDLKFHQVRHVMTPTADLGLYHDTWLSVALPIVLSQSRELELDGIDRADSTTLIDGLLPAGGFDAKDPGVSPPGDLVFRGIDRAGLDQVHLGLAVAPMNQARDPSKPTWKMGAEIRLAIGKVMRFDPMLPDSEQGVSRGVHELRLWTTFARRLGRVEGWTELFWQTPVHHKPDSLFDDPGFGATNTGLGQLGGVSFGLEVFPLDDRVNRNRIGIDLGARAIAHFEGREYSEMWEVFGFAGDARGTGPLILDADPLDAGVQALSHPGVSNVENYLETGARFAVRAELGTFVRFGAVIDLVWKTDHAISFADAGIDLPTCAQGVGACEDEENDLVNPGTAEVNPLHAPRIDLVGHRYHAVENFGIVVGVHGQLLF